MNRAVLVLFNTLLLCLSACGGGDDEINYPDREVKLPQIEGLGSLSGTVHFLGDPPKLRPLTAPASACGAHDGKIPDESIVVKDGKLQGVLVYIQEGLEDWTFPYNKTEATIDQKGCQFVPHVLALQAWQPIRISNSDPLAHNINVKAKQQQGFVVSFPGQNSVVRQLKKPELSMRATCELHGNMLMYIHVLDHPFFAVTGSDGTFEFKDLPPGTYRVAARHEELGEQSQSLVVDENGKIENFDFKFSR